LLYRIKSAGEPFERVAKEQDLFATQQRLIDPSQPTRAQHPSHDEETAAPKQNGPPMNETIAEIQRLLQEIVAHLGAGTKADTRKAITKLERISVLASTFALTLQVRR